MSVADVRDLLAIVESVAKEVKDNRWLPLSNLVTLCGKEYRIFVSGLTYEVWGTTNGSERYELQAKNRLEGKRWLQGTLLELNPFLVSQLRVMKEVKMLADAELQRGNLLIRPLSNFDCLIESNGYLPLCIQWADRTVSEFSHTAPQTTKTAWIHLVSSKIINRMEKELYHK